MFTTRHDEKYYDRTKFQTYLLIHKLQTIRKIILKTNVMAITKQCIFTICLLVLLSNHAHAEDWTQLGFGGVQGFRYDEQFAVGAMGLMNIELKHRHPKAWINHYSRLGFLGAFEYHNTDSTLSGTLQLSLISFWASNEALLQLSAGPVWTDAVGVETGGSAMLLLHYKPTVESSINSGSLFLRVDTLNGEKVSIGLSIGHSILERFSD